MPLYIVIYSARSKIAQMQGAVVCRFIGALKNAHKWAGYRYIRSAATKAKQQMDIFQRELFKSFPASVVEIILHREWMLNWLKALPTCQCQCPRLLWAAYHTPAPLQSRHPSNEPLYRRLLFP